MYTFVYFLYAFPVLSSRLAVVRIFQTNTSRACWRCSDSEERRIGAARQGKISRELSDADGLVFPGGIYGGT